MEANVVGGRKTGHVLVDLFRLDAFHLTTDDDGDLALVVEKTRAVGAANLAKVAVQRRWWLHEVRRLRWRLGLVLGEAGLVRQVDGEDLRGLGGC